jgi:hypothetical protein
MGEPRKRNLTDREKAGFEIVKNFEKAIRDGRLTITLSSTRAAAEVIGKYDGTIFRVLKCVFVPARMEYAVTFDLPNYRRYMHFILPHCGLKLNIDGTLDTADNLVISNEYLGNEMESKK